MSYGPRLVAAFEMAAELHRGQVRKGAGVPYLTHLMAVAALVGGAGGSEDELIAALLHDGPEDQGGVETLGRIRRAFGDAVADTVAGCSDTFEVPKPPWRGRKESFIRRLASATSSVRLVVCADKLHNTRTLLADLRETGGGFDWSIFKGGRDGSLWYYRTVLETLRPDGAPPRLLDSLGRVVDELELLAVGGAV